VRLDPQEPLTREELERLERQERLVTRVHAVGLGVLVLLGIAAYSYRESSWVRGLFLGALLAMAAAAAVVQLMERCPRCGARLRRRLLVAPPESCAACGVRLVRPPDDDVVSPRDRHYRSTRSNAGGAVPAGTGRNRTREVSTMMLARLCRVASVGVLSVPLAGLPAGAQDYPTRNVTIVVPLAAGSGMDSIVRIYADDLGKALGKAVVVENQPGAALMLAAQNVARARPDGHTLVVASAPVLAVNPTLYKKVNYDAEKDFAPIALYAKSPFVLIVNPAFGARSMQDYIKKAQDSANPLTYATTGAGTLQYLTMEVLKRDHRFKASHVAYRSPPQIVNDIVGGHIVSSISETGAALSLIQEGKIEALGITASSRLPALPKIPTLAEAMGMPGFEAVSWHVLLAPSKTPRPIVERLHAEMKRITGNPEFQKRVSAIGLMPLEPRSIGEIEATLRASGSGGVVW
jgi:tripartite-type tricarboxylate transporter receptor subunit TctC